MYDTLMCKVTPKQKNSLPNTSLSRCDVPFYDD